MIYLIKEFIIIGCIAFSGGLVVLPFIQNIAEVTGWINENNIIEMMALSEIIPGPIAVNMATYVGYIVEGIPGGILVTLALILPQIIIVYVIYKIFNKVKDNQNVIYVLKGIKPVTLALTTGATLSIFQTSFINGNEENKITSNVLFYNLCYYRNSI